MLVALIISILAIWLMWWLLSGQRENYGPVKNIRKIPMSECRSICQQYYQKCLEDDIHNINAGWCDMKFGEACEAECRYSNYHRA